MQKKLITLIILGVLLITFVSGCTSTPTEPSASSPSTTIDPAPSTHEPGYQLAESLARASLLSLRIETGSWSEKMQANKDYIASLDAQRFLYYYYETGGVNIPEGLRPYAGCESDNAAIWHGGMTMGHMLSANAMLYAVTGESQWKDTVTFMIDELEKCQLPNGYLFSKPESLFDNMEKQIGGEANWGVLYYYMHKVFAGLIDAYNWCGNEKALALAERLSDWVSTRMGALTDSQRALVLKTEYGGMNEALYNLYAITGNPRDKQNAEYFNEAMYLDNWAKGIDNLNMKHGNTTIPKAVGYIRGYQLTGDEKLLKAAVNFWDMTAGSGNRIFATGALSERETLGIANYTSKMIYDSPGETCKSYNMLKLTQYLYETTGEMKYVDYIERVLLNALMGSIDEQGCKTYYQWLDTDAHKLFHTEFTTFWCCMGTGIETFSKVPEACWYTDGDSSLRLNVFISSTYSSDALGITLANDEEKNTLTIQHAPTSEYTLKLRVPYWSGDVTVKINGESQATSAENGYIVLKRIWQSGDVIEYVTPYQGYTESTPDNADLFAVKYGPYVLAAVGKRYEAGNQLAGSFESGYLADLTNAITRTADGYVLTTPDFEVPMQKYGEIIEEYYTVYFKRIDAFADGALSPDPAMRAAVSSSRSSMKDFPKKNQYEREFYASITGGKADYLDPIHDGRVPTSSLGYADPSKYMQPAFTFYEPFTSLARGERWLCYTFETEQTLSSSSVFFCNNPDIDVLFPDSWHLEYYDGSNWKAVTNTSDYTANDGWNEVTFETIKTTQLRLVLKSENAMGVFEWKVS